MSNSVFPSAPPRRRSWPLLVVFGLLVALAVAWTGLWFYAASQAKTQVAAWFERERRAGRQQDCASLSIGGYPFRIEVRCDGGVFELAELPGYKLNLPSLLAMAQIYDPRAMISEMTGPLNISQRSGGNDYLVNWSIARVSMRGLPSEPERGSLAFDNLSVREGAAAGNAPAFGAQHFELHGRPASGSRADEPAIETVLQLKQAVAGQIHALLARPTDADISGVIHGLDGLTRKPLPEQLKQWQARGGQAEITEARIRQDDIIAAGAGALRLTARGGLDGNLRVTIVGIEKILKMLDLERVMSEGQVGSALNALDQLMPGLGSIARRSAAPGLVAVLGQRGELDGKPATTLAVRFVDGKAFLGPFPVGEVPPLF